MRELLNGSHIIGHFIGLDRQKVFSLKNMH